MAWKSEGRVISAQAASAIGQYLPVFLPLGSSRDETVVPAGTSLHDLIGFTVATQATYGYEVPVMVDGVTKAIAGASLGAGARVQVGSSNGRLIPVQASGLPPVPSGGGTSIAAQAPKYSPGIALHAAADGDIFSVLLAPREII